MKTTKTIHDERVVAIKFRFKENTSITIKKHVVEFMFKNNFEARIDRAGRTDKEMCEVVMPMIEEYLCDEQDLDSHKKYEKMVKDFYNVEDEAKQTISVDVRINSNERNIDILIDGRKNNVDLLVEYLDVSDVNNSFHVWITRDGLLSYDKRLRVTLNNEVDFYVQIEASKQLKITKDTTEKEIIENVSEAFKSVVDAVEKKKEEQVNINFTAFLDL